MGPSSSSSSSPAAAAAAAEEVEGLALGFWGGLRRVEACAEAPAPARVGALPKDIGKKARMASSSISPPSAIGRSPLAAAAPTSCVLCARRALCFSFLSFFFRAGRCVFQHGRGEAWCLSEKLVESVRRVNLGPTRKTAWQPRMVK